jgi:hypothetical protein
MPAKGVGFQMVDARWRGPLENLNYTDALHMSWDMTRWRGPLENLNYTDALHMSWDMTPGLKYKISY